MKKNLFLDIKINKYNNNMFLFLAYLFLKINSIF